MKKAETSAELTDSVFNTAFAANFGQLDEQCDGIRQSYVVGELNTNSDWV